MYVFRSMERGVYTYMYRYINILDGVFFRREVLFKVVNLNVVFFEELDFIIREGSGFEFIILLVGSRY